MGIAGLVILSFILLLLSVNGVRAQNWTVMQTLTDAYLSRETALGKRIPFDQMTRSDSLWPAQPQMASQAVIIGRLPGGRPVEATLWRTREPDPSNPISGGTAASAPNPAGMEIWRLRSFLSYSIGEKTYLKGRSVIRAR